MIYGGEENVLLTPAPNLSPPQGPLVRHVRTIVYTQGETTGIENYLICLLVR